MAATAERDCLYLQVLYMYEKYMICTEKIKRIIGDFKSEIAVILGSGLGNFADRLDVKFSVDFSELEGFPVSTVKGHSGRFLFGVLNGKNILAVQGRVHFYEGYSPQETVLPIRIIKMLGCSTLILTNASGGINDTFKSGDIMLITDHISLFANSPLIGKNIDELGTRFPDMSEVYDKKLQDIASMVAKEYDIDLKKGIYAQVTGPQYETPAEVRSLKILGADAVGMSTATEAIAAVHCGMRVCGLALITNPAAGVSGNRLSHEEVIITGKKSAEKFETLLCGIIKNIN